MYRTQVNLPKRTKLLTLRDLFRFGGARLVPSEPCSPYRYMEFLIECVAQKKFKPKTVMEVGPGIDTALNYLNLEQPKRIMAVDYNNEVVAAIRRRYPKVEVNIIDLSQISKLNELGGLWDYIICNSVVEHVIDDQILVDRLYDLLCPGGIIVCSTVLHQRMYNTWDWAVGHYRRYSVEEFEALFRKFTEIQLIKTAMIQEVARPFFFGRLKHLTRNTIEQNNRLCGREQEEWGRSPYAGIWFIIKYLMPIYLVFEWAKRSLFGGIGIIIARKAP